MQRDQRKSQQQINGSTNQNQINQQQNNYKINSNDNQNNSVLYMQQQKNKLEYDQQDLHLQLLNIRKQIRQSKDYLTQSKKGDKRYAEVKQNIDKYEKEVKQLDQQKQKLKEQKQQVDLQVNELYQKINQQQNNKTGRQQDFISKNIKQGILDQQAKKAVQYAQKGLEKKFTKNQQKILQDNENQQNVFKNKLTAKKRKQQKIKHAEQIISRISGKVIGSQKSNGFSIQIDTQKTDPITCLQQIWPKVRQIIKDQSKEGTLQHVKINAINLQQNQIQELPTQSQDWEQNTPLNAQQRLINGMKFAARNHQKYKNIQDAKQKEQAIKQDKSIKQDYKKIEIQAKTGNQIQKEQQEQQKQVKKQIQEEQKIIKNVQQQQKIEQDRIAKLAKLQQDTMLTRNQKKKLKQLQKKIAQRTSEEYYALYGVDGDFFDDYELDYDHQEQQEIVNEQQQLLEEAMDQIMEDEYDPFADQIDEYEEEQKEEQKEYRLQEESDNESQEEQKEEQKQQQKERDFEYKNELTKEQAQEILRKYFQITSIVLSFRYKNKIAKCNKTKFTGQRKTENEKYKLFDIEDPQNKDNLCILHCLNNKLKISIENQNKIKEMINDAIKDSVNDSELFQAISDLLNVSILVHKYQYLKIQEKTENKQLKNLGKYLKTYMKYGQQKQNVSLFIQGNHCYNVNGYNKNIEFFITKSQNIDIMYKNDNSITSILCNFDEQMFIEQVVNKNVVKQTNEQKCEEIVNVYGFDFETVFSIHNFNNALLFSYTIIQNNQKITNEYLDQEFEETELVYDNDLRRNVQRHKQYKQSYLKFLCGLTNKFLDLSQDKCVMIGFNNSAFDNYILLKIFTITNQIQYFNEINKNKSKLQTMQLNNMKIIDYKGILGQGTLKQQCKNYGLTNAKLDMNHKQVQLNYEQNGKITYFDTIEKRQNLIEYNERDVECLLEIRQKVNDSFQEVFKQFTDSELDQKNKQKILKSIENLNFYTVSQIILDIHNRFCKQQNIKGTKYIFNEQHKKYKKDTKILDKDGNEKIIKAGTQFIKKSNFHVYEDCKKGKLGGRTQCFQSDYHTGIIDFIDFTSHYPSVQTSQNNYYPDQYVCTLEKINNFNQYLEMCPNNKFQSIFVIKNIDQQSLQHNIIPIRKKIGTLDWISKQIIDNEIVLAQPEVQLLSDYNISFNIVKIHKYTSIQGSKLFGVISRLFSLKSHQDDIKEHKSHCKNQCQEKICQEQYNESQRNLAKLLFNSLYGKMLQQIYYEKTVVVKNKQDLTNMQLNYKDSIYSESISESVHLYKASGYESKEFEKQAKNIQQAIFVYSYARVMYYKIFLSLNLDVIQGDTDSCAIRFKNEEERIQFIENCKKNGINYKKDQRSKLQSLTNESTEKIIKYKQEKDEKIFKQMFPKLSKILDKKDYDLFSTQEVDFHAIAPKFYYVFDKNNGKELKKGSKGMSENDVILDEQYHIERFNHQQKISQLHELSKTDQSAIKLHKKACKEATQYMNKLKQQAIEFNRNESLPTVKNNPKLISQYLIKYGFCMLAQFQINKTCAKKNSDIGFNIFSEYMIKVIKNDV